MSVNEITIQAYYQAVKLMFSDQPVSEGMRSLGKTARSLVPNPVWDVLGRIDFDHELPALQAWLEPELRRHSAGVSILLFRLSEFGDRLTLVFLRPQRAPGGDDDWQAYDDSAAVEAPSTVLERLAEIAETDLSDGSGGYSDADAGWILETCYPLAYCGLAAARLMQRLPLDAVLGNDVRRRVAVFFEDGDDFFLGEIDAAGFRYAAIPAFIPGSS